MVLFFLGEPQKYALIRAAYLTFQPVHFQFQFIFYVACGCINLPGFILQLMRRLTLLFFLIFFDCICKRRSVLLMIVAIICC